MRWARTFGVAAAAAAATTMVAGCQKPPPAISVWSGTNSINTPALCWAGDEDSLSAQQCAGDILQGTRSDGLPTLPTTVGSTFGISVDQAVADAGWQIRVDGQPIVPQILEDTYFRVVYSTPAQPITLQVVAGRDAEIKGVWLIKLDPGTQG
jgi:hypothetical protein